MSSTRQPGFYWVKVEKTWKWSVQLFEYGYWHVHVGTNGFTKFKDSEIYEINETRIPAPDESEYNHRFYGENMAIMKGYEALNDPEYVRHLENLTWEQGATPDTTDVYEILKERMEHISAWYGTPTKVAGNLQSALRRIIWPNEPPIPNSKVWDMAVEACKDEVREMVDKKEIDIEYRSDVNGELFNIDNLLGNVRVDNPFLKSNGTTH
jgi:hypothetical protein